MTFEEFFNKKRIDLVALKAAEPGLYAEFEKHFAQMGEKSFDHTKKYWFNKLRLLYHLAPGLKPEKMRQENQLAEQTIVETLTEAIPAPTTGFKPRFKPGMLSKPASATSDVQKPAPEHSATATPEVNEAATIKDQDPPFEQAKEAMQDAADATPRTTDTVEAKTEPLAAKPGFKTRFNMKMTKGDAPQTKEFEKEPKPESETQVPESAGKPDVPKPGFKPRFNMKTMAPKAIEAEDTEPETKPATETIEPAAEPEKTAPKPAGFKPRFNMKTMAPKAADSIAENTEDKEHPVKEKPEDITAAKPPEEAPASPKIGFKPRFNAKATKAQPPEAPEE
ncbi:hypothetical protein [Mucilaginibacter phyllosphaerae]|uniref:Uncharacterized protein n=1 Tax=Mucilaginibacter phyllosphaerae TaxID=1812349 RepID=A0A4Y8AAE8_9SPHI|nr:hypothetical protein [Mucilaginibacter phyllosphaerae]MBB3969560.1 hypothetical protein [Mucilaginibacter phyllosphaerae]TEW64952.1 hypothetical protein E2R65_13585 [Mucilaginibacter phyllosphaerae]GGH18907.1 hypothetical protein GCM10007352_29940 [Mucilaginibacter phyllosphaerae]